jgi:hypothetical protein
LKLLRWLIIIGFFLLGFYLHNEIWAAVNSGHPFDQTMIRALIRCRIYPEEMAVLTGKGGKRCTIPLPSGTTHFLDNTYLTTSHNFDKYLEITLLSYGWTQIIQRDEQFMVRDKGGYKRFTIINRKYAGVYRRLSFMLE